jgi:hypothetical protein
MSTAVDLQTQINKQGDLGWRFHSMAQKVTQTKDLRTGQNKVELIIIFERSYQVDTDQTASA